MDLKAALLGTIDAEVVEAPIRGQLLLERPLWNKGTAFSEEERRSLGLIGLLPPHEETLDEQVARAYEAYEQRPGDLERHIYLRELQDTNTTLFYRLLLDRLDEMMPIIYTPTVGLACQQFSHIFRRPRGLFLSYAERDSIDAILDNAASPQIQVIVVTDGERILGLGDQGAGGMGIPIGKLSLYTVCGGVHPATTLPILLDVGTNNEERLRDPLYIGWRHERISGQEYDDFVDRFVQAVMRKFPGVLLQWEDFAQANAGRLLDRYRDQLCTFNDDIQGTAAVATGTLLSAVSMAGGQLRDQRIAILGAGSAGCGIGEQLVAEMKEEGLSEAEARANFFLIDRQGLLHDAMNDLRSFQRKFAQPKDRVIGWSSSEGQPISLLDVVKNARPTILIGVSGQPGTFTEEIVRAMAACCDRPIIFPLSNPTSRTEAKPCDLIAWTEGRAIVATGSPFREVVYGGRRYPIAQCNNSHIFPALGLGILASCASRVTDAMFMAAARALRECSPSRRDPTAPLLPPLSETRQVARAIALAVAAAAERDGVAEPCSSDESPRRIAKRMWEPRYVPMVRKRS
jgi:malate dehydrogenase (oxaloacetate-decarboxylating)